MFAYRGSKWMETIETIEKLRKQAIKGFDVDWEKRFFATTDINTGKNSFCFDRNNLEQLTDALSNHQDFKYQFQGSNAVRGHLI